MRAQAKDALASLNADPRGTIIVIPGRGERQVGEAHPGVDGHEEADGQIGVDGHDREIDLLAAHRGPVGGRDDDAAL